MKPADKSMETIVALAKNRGFIYPGSEIYGGLANSGLRSLRHGTQAQRQRGVVEELRSRKPYNVGIDAAILMNPEVWVASGHVGGFRIP